MKSARERPRILVLMVVMIQTLQKDRLQNAVYDVILVPKSGKQNINFFTNMPVVLYITGRFLSLAMTAFTEKPETFNLPGHRSHVKISVTRP